MLIKNKSPQWHQTPFGEDGCRFVGRRVSSVGTNSHFDSRRIVFRFAFCSSSRSAISQHRRGRVVGRLSYEVQSRRSCDRRYSCEEPCRDATVHCQVPSWTRVIFLALVVTCISREREREKRRSLGRDVWRWLDESNSERADLFR